MDDERQVDATLQGRPELEDALHTVSASVDGDDWTFDDVPLDSGTFGELVSAGLVEKTDDGYRLPEETVRALDGEGASDGEAATAGRDLLPTVDLDPRASLAFAGTLLTVVLFRTSFSYGSVFRNGDIVLSGNDPYAYRYFVEQLLAQNSGSFNASALGDVPTATGEPLYVSTLWWVASVLGDGATAAGTALAWYPVVSAVLTASLLYLLAVELTGDRRVGLAALLFFATTPGHAMRTSLGFADHHAFDYPWLVLTALFFVFLAGRDEAASRDPGTWLLGLGVGVGIAGQVLAWENGPALVFPVAVVLVFLVLLDVEADRSPLVTTVPLLGGLALAAGLTQFAHTDFGWHPEFIALTPALLLVGGVMTVIVGEACFRADISTRTTAALETALGVGGLFVVVGVFPGFWATAADRLTRFFETRNIAETQALFSGDLLWFLLLGTAILVALPPLVVAAKRAADGSRRWLVAAVYTCYLLVLAAFQVRFVGELATFVSLFAGVGFVWLAHWVDLAAPPGGLSLAGSSSDSTPGGDDRQSSSLRLPSGREMGLLAVLFLLVGGVGMLQVPIKTGQVTIDSTEYRTATWIGQHSAMTNESYPDNYVLSQWGRNRMYNYFVSGRSESYGYARDRYPNFSAGTDGQRWYEQLRGRVGYVITEDFDLSSDTLNARLHHGYGTESETTDPLVHYRALYASPDDSLKVFQLVEGAVVAGRVGGNETAVVRANVSIPGDSFVYERRVSTTDNGWYVFRAPHPGNYSTPNGTTTRVTPEETAGQVANEPTGSAHWRFDEGSGTHVFEAESGYPGDARNVTWTDGLRGQALSLDGDGFAAVPASYFDTDRSFTLSVWFRTSDDVDYEIDQRFARIAARADGSQWRNTDGYQLGLWNGDLLGAAGNGSDATRLVTENVDDGQWHHAVLRRNGTTVSLYLDGELREQGQFAGRGTAEPLVFGASSDRKNRFTGRLDEARHYTRSLSDAEIASLYESQRPD